MRNATIIPILLLTVLTLIAVADAQVTCFSYPGGMISCDGPRNQNTIQQDFGNGQGVIMDPRGEITPYAVIPSQPDRPLSMAPPALPRMPAFNEPVQPSPSPYFVPGFGGDAEGSPY